MTRDLIDPDDIRASFGEHLEELRLRLIYALVGVCVAAVGCWFLKGPILGFILRPVQVVLNQQGQSPRLLSLGPADPFMIALKLAVLTGLLVAAPWVLYQAWKFVSVGLYPRERRFVKMFLPGSVVLFFVGVAFLFFIVLPVAMQFFVTFSTNWPLGDLEPTWVERKLLGITESTPTSQPAGGPVPLHVPMLSRPPQDPKPGEAWYSPQTGEFCVQTENGPYTANLRKRTGGSGLVNQFGIQDYVSMVLMLSLAFGLTFQTPIIVLFLAITGLVSVDAMARSRRYVIFACVVIGAVLTPTADIINQMLLSGPMWILFEIGLLVARLAIKPPPASERTPSDQ
jgi:sec-independent protein translocase protein TatC